MPRAIADNGRVELRLRPQDKAMLSRAAALERQDLTGYILGAVLPRAEADIAEAERLQLTERDSRIVLELLEQPPAPTDRLLRVARAGSAAEVTGLDWSEAPIGKAHERDGFDCGEEELNLYLRRYARQNHASGGAKCFVAAPIDAPTRVLGYYTLAPASLVFARTPEIVRKGLARYDVPAFRLGRLAVARSVQGRGLGGALLLRAAGRCLRVASEVGGVALLIDAKSERAARWYESYGAMRLADAPLSLVLALATAAEALRQA